MPSSLTSGSVPGCGSVRDLLQYALRSAPSSLIPAACRDAIDLYGAMLPAVVWAGFEARLSEQRQQIDVHLGIRRGHPGASTLFATLNGLARSDRFTRLGELWCNAGSAISQGVDYLVFEFDMHEDPAHLPALFITFREDLASSARLALTREVLGALDMDDVRRVRVVERLFSACQGPERISHVGLMLSRDVRPLRVNVRNVNRDRLAPYLHAVGHPGPTDAFERGGATFLRFVDRFTLCLDVIEEVQDRLGLELTIARQPYEDPRYAHLFAELVSQGLCTTARAEALLDWPGLSTPAQHGDEWPEGLLVESLTRPAPSLSAIKRRVSHVKLDFLPDQIMAAKAYFGVERVWLDPDSGRATGPTIKQVADTAPRARTAVEVGTAIGRALTFLETSRHQSGWWRDYPAFPIASSDEWPTAYVGSVLCEIDAPDARRMAREAWALLDGCGRDDGWGWSRWTPADADSTSWALRLAAGLDIPDSPLVKHARRFLKSHQRRDGGVATYLPEQFEDAGAEGGDSRRAGWYDAHTCVTGAAARVDVCAAAALDYLRRSQHENGSWSGFWWPDDVFATALATQAIGARGYPRDGALIQRAAAWVIAKVDAQGAIVSEALADRSAFATACGLSVLVHARHAAGDAAAHTMDRMVGWLSANQQPSGDWVASALMYFPDPFSPPDNLYTDGAGIFTTATVLAALNAYRRTRPEG